MRVNLCTLTFDFEGSVEIDCLLGSTLGALQRRMTRVATLDGGAVFNDFGFSHSDRTAELRWLPESATKEAAIKRLVMLYSRLVLTAEEGAYEVAPQRYREGARESVLNLLIVRKLNE